MLKRLSLYRCTEDAREHHTAKHHRCDARSGPWAHRTQYSRVWLCTVVLATARNPSTTGGEKKGKPLPTVSGRVGTRPHPQRTVACGSTNTKETLHRNKQYESEAHLLL